MNSLALYADKELKQQNIKEFVPLCPTIWSDFSLSNLDRQEVKINVDMY